MKINMKEINAAIACNFENMSTYEWDSLVVPKSWNIESMELVKTTTDGHGASDFYGQEIRVWKITVKNTRKVKKYMDNTFTFTVYEYTEECKASALFDGSKYAA